MHSGIDAYMHLWYNLIYYLIFFMNIMKLSTQKKSKVKPSFSSNSTKKPKWYMTEEFELNDGDILVYRDTRSGQFWRMRVWISDEKRYDDKSLKTKDKENAIVIAKERYLDIQWKIKNVKEPNIYI